MGTHGASGKGKLEKYLLGSNAYRTVHQTHADVITIRTITDKIKFDNVVVPIDATKDTTQKVAEAEKIASVFGSTLHLIAVSSFLDEFATSQTKLERQIRLIAENLTKKGFEVKTKILRHENVADEVMGYAKSQKADLVLILTRGENKIKELTLGSNARRVISESQIPVISFHPKG